VRPREKMSEGTGSLTVAARNETPRYRTATVRESVPFAKALTETRQLLKPSRPKTFSLTAKLL
jgi:hypothetical protein